MLSSRAADDPTSPAHADDSGPGSRLIDVFWQTAERHSQAAALVEADQTITYSELAAAVRATASELALAPAVVEVPATHGADTVRRLLAVWAAGSTYCPVDPAFPSERRALMRAVAAAPADAHEQERGGPAYLLFTSGSTGRPKPVSTPHQAIRMVTAALVDLFGLTPADRVLQFASLNWDTCFEEILPTLTTGATLVIDPDAYAGSFPRFLRMLERHHVTVLDLPTAFWHELVRHLADSGLGLPSSVRLLVIGGEAVDPAMLAAWCRLDTTQIRLVNTYGSTETTLVTHAVDLHGPRALDADVDWSRAERVPLGHPLPHVREHIGAESELYVGGPCIALGYRGMADETRARFVALDGSADRYFRTGDRVARTPDGMLQLLGRLDHEVKVRGIRVDPGEVESHLISCPGVAAAAVVGSTLAGRTALLAYVVPQPDADPAGLDSVVRSHLTGRVPGHLVPSRITVVAALAMTASGKLDRVTTHEHHSSLTAPKEQGP